jgi:hypothetical protein
MKKIAHQGIENRKKMHGAVPDIRMERRMEAAIKERSSPVIPGMSKTFQLPSAVSCRNDLSYNPLTLSNLTDSVRLRLSARCRS